MKIAILHSGFMPSPPLRGGAVEKMWHRLALEFARRGHEVTQISRACDGLPVTETIAGVRHRRADGFDRPKSMWRAIWRDARWNLRSRGLLPLADVVVTNSFLAPLLLPRGCGSIYVDVQRMPKGQMKLYQRAARLRANSTAVVEAIVAEAPGMRDRVRMIPNPLPFVPERLVNWECKTRTVLFVGRLNPEKGIELLLEAWQLARQHGRLRGWKLELVGPADVEGGGGGEGWVRELQARFAAPDVAWHPPVYDTAALGKIYERAAVFVYPSLAERGETFGLAVLEAMAWGAVPVVSGLACFRDFLQPGSNGWSFDHRGAGGAKALMVALDEAAGADLRTMGARAVAVRDSHSSVSIAERFLADFAKIA